MLQARLWPFHDHSTRKGWVVSITPRPYFTPGKDPVPIVQEAVWAPGPVWTGGKSRPIKIRSPDRPARKQSLYQLSYPAHKCTTYFCKIPKYQISWESIYLFLSCCKHTDKQTDIYSNFDTYSLGMQTCFNRTVKDEVNVRLLSKEKCLFSTDPTLKYLRWAGI